MRVLQSAACDAGTWANGSWHGCVFDPMTQATGGDPLFGLLVGGATILGMYVAGSGDIGPPSVITILFAGVLFGMLPAGVVNIAWGVAFVGLAGGIVGIAQRYFLAPGTR